MLLFKIRSPMTSSARKNGVDPTALSKGCRLKTKRKPLSYHKPQSVLEWKQVNGPSLDYSF